MADESEKKIKLSELMTQHKQRFRFQTKAGWITLKHIGKLDHQEIFMRLCEDVPGYEEAANLHQQFRELAKHPGGVPPDKIAERDRVRAICAAHNHEFYIPCIIEPEITSLDELKALVDGLDKTEWDALQQMLLTLVAPLPAREQNLLILGLCREYRFPLAPDLFLNNLTLQQADAMILSDQQAMAELEKLKPSGT